MRSGKRLLEGWPLVGWTGLGVATLVGAILLTRGSGEAAVHLILRTTARTSFLLFMSAFLASALRRLWRIPLTGWMLRNRQYLGVSFAVSHGFHGLAILTAALVWHERLHPVVVAFGGLGYLFIAAMTATSFDRTAAWLGARRWRALHGVGVHYIWAIFFLNFVALGVRSAFYLPFATLAAAAPIIRLAAWWKSRHGPAKVVPG
jgi:methionine sulfoxide reductase heme-binding subunit